MNAQETQIARKILDALHNEDGRQVHIVKLHADIGGMVVCGATELDAILLDLERQRYVNKLKTKFRGVMWNITDAGEAARLEM